MKLYNEDCLKILKDIPDESIDLVLTDCPYRIINGGCSKGIYGNESVKMGWVYEKLEKQKREQSGILNKRKEKPEFDYIYTKSGRKVRVLKGTKHQVQHGIMDDSDPTTYTKQGKLFKYNDIKFSEWLPDVYRVLKKGTHCYIMINARNLCELQTEAEKVGFVFQNLLVWNKTNSGGTPNRYYMNKLEFILLLSKRPARDINNMGTHNLLSFDNIIGNKLHPTQKNTEMLKVLIENSTNKGEVVLDPFMGVGTTGVASRELDRDFIGIEIDEKYYDIANKVLNGETNYGELQNKIKPKKDNEIKEHKTLFDFFNNNSLRTIKGSPHLAICSNCNKELYISSKSQYRYIKWIDHKLNFFCSYSCMKDYMEKQNKENVNSN